MSVADMITAAKVLAVSAGAVGTVGLAMIGVWMAAFDEGVRMTALKVPRALEEVGYSSETATQRLIDEIAALNKASISAKERTPFGDGKLYEALAQVDTPAGAVSFQEVRLQVQKWMGRQVVQISGDITQRQQGEAAIYRLRLRQAPERDLLIDVEVAGTPEDLFRQAAMGLLERLDPMIAASIHMNRRDYANANRLISAVLAGDRPGEEKNALNARAQIHIAHGRWPEAERSVEQALQRDPDFWAALTSKAIILRNAKRSDEALAVSERIIAVAPNLCWGYFHKAMTLRELGRRDEALDLFRSCLKRAPREPWAYYQTAVTLGQLGRKDEAYDLVAQGSTLLPASALLRFALGEVLRERGETSAARDELQRAVDLDPRNLNFLVALAELQETLGEADQARALTDRIRQNQASAGGVLPGIRPRMQRLLDRIRS